MIALIDYGAGNTASVANVLDELKAEYKITTSERDICNAEKIIFPGVGEASFAVRKLHVLNLFTQLRIIKKPLLGICLGMQLMCETSEEGNVSCLGCFNERVKKFDESKVKVPHMGWNKVKITKESKLFEDIPDDSFFYFAHSYYVPGSEYATSLTEHGINYTTSMEKDNYYGVQFHPEKSGEKGIQIVKNFIEKC